MKTFTLDEAQMLLPIIESLLKRAIGAKRTAEEIEGELQRLNQRIFFAGGMLVRVAEVAKRKLERDASVQQAKDLLAEIDSIGVQVKDLETGLLDFPCKLEDEIVLLCWRLGESEIAHWHRVEDGFRGRRPIDARFGDGFKKSTKDRPN